MQMFVRTRESPPPPPFPALADRTAAVVDIFNSHGLCYDFCMSRGKAFAIVQFTGCWCSDLAPDPSKSADKKECSKGCPGYDKETCGSLEKDLYSYMRLPNIVKGTVGVTSTRTTASKTVGKPTPATESKTVIVPTTIVSIVVCLPSASQKFFFQSNASVRGSMHAAESCGIIPMP